MINNYKIELKLSLLFLCIFGSVFQLFLLFPGIYSPDSIDQFNQAVTGNFSDWHPPVMALLWRIQINLFRTEILFYALHIVSFWLSLYIIARHLPSKWWVPLLILSLGFAPFTLNFLGVVWKDVSLGVSAMLAAALLLDARLAGRPITFLRGLMIGLLLSYAALVRINGAFLVAPFLLASLGKWNKPFSWQPFVAVALTFVAILVAPLINQRVIGARDSGASISLQVFDIGGISHFSKTNLFPGNWSSDEEQEIITKCYDGLAWDVYAWGKCEFVLSKIDRKNFARTWIQSIFNHPIYYMKHRITYYNNFIRFIGDYSGFGFVYSKDPSYPDSNIANSDHYLYRKFVEFLNLQYNAIWFMPYFWLSASIMLFIVTIEIKDNDRIRVINSIAFGSIFYIISYFPFGVASDFRYCFPSIVFILIGSLTLLAEFLSNSEEFFYKWQLVLLSIPVLMIGAGWWF